MNDPMGRAGIRGIFTSSRNRKAASVLAISVLIALAADYYVGVRQEQALIAREERLKKLQKQAFYMLSVDVRDIRETAGIRKSGKYAATIRIDNVADEPVYIDYPEVRVFVQTGTISWSELPVTDPEPEKKEQLYKLGNGAHRFPRVLTVARGIPYNRYLIPKYMHLRFIVRMSVLPESGFKEGELFERKSDIYVYLKPFWISEKEIAAAIDFGDTRVPVYLPITGFRNWNN